MDLNEYVSQYGCCAINNIPGRDAAIMLCKEYPVIFANCTIGGLPLSTRNVRFVNGKWKSFCSTPYNVGGLFNCEAVVDYNDLDLYGWSSDECQIDISALL